MSERIVPVRHGVDMVVHSDRDELVPRVLGDLDAIADRGLRMLRGFLADTFAPDRGEFDLITVELADELTLRFAWLDRADPVEWNDTWFDVTYLVPDPLREDGFRPVRFAVGFW